MTTRFNFATALVGAFLVITPLGSVSAAETDSKKPDETYKLLQLFGDVFERVRGDYVEKPSDKALIEAAINGMLSSLDPHSSYLTADSFEDMQVQTKGEFGGLGIEVTLDSGVVKVVSPIDDTPAFRAGLQPGDFITHLDGEPVLGLTLSQAVDKMRGPVGADITIKVLREGQDPFDVTLTRAVVKIQAVRSHLEGDIAYVRITSFNEQAASGLTKAMKSLRADLQKENKDKTLKGMVLDLRANPGGLLDQAISVSDAFLEQGEIVSIRSEQHPEDGQRYNARPGDLTEGMPVVVLINGGSASASEIVAGALQDHGRAILMGTKSFGKGSVQTISPLGEYGAMRMTTARYYTPSGRSIQSVGITPDIIVPQSKIESLEPESQPRERDLRGALDKENGQKADPKSTSKVDPKADKKDVKKDETKDETKDAKKADAVDYQLNRALDLIRGINLYKDMSPAPKG
ncbi:S41 family peptidase [Magnetovibrio blakemorei]|uniref:Peptidase S41 n=1 Tax=Magnetovibrio blakemorei TaxID=28181 RepID=A0A1E5Q7C7_9PROT|nr:S41 family peptidase [Magnetovibrio blakemorei]OEJ67076.1 peptidase S41 [Magnetovibrio blakemorei]